MGKQRTSCKTVRMAYPWEINTGGDWPVGGAWFAGAKARAQTVRDKDDTEKSERAGRGRYTYLLFFFLGGGVRERRDRDPF